MNSSPQLSHTPRVPEALRRFGQNLADQVRLRAKFAAAVTVATTATIAASPALADPTADELLPPLVPLVPLLPPKTEAPKIEASPPSRPWSLEAGTEIPVTSTHDFFNGAGAYVRGTRQLPPSFGGIRGSACVAWNPIVQQPATDDPLFKPRNPRQRFHGNAVRATVGAAYPFSLHEGSDFDLDLEAGGDAGVALFNVGSHRDVAVNQAGDLADIPAYDGVTAVVEGHAELAAHFGERLRLALGLRYGQSPFAVQTRAAARQGAHLNYLHANAGLGVQF